jgi:transcription elongation factor Elf1
MKLIRSKDISEFVERYFNCPYCHSLVTDGGGDDFKRDQKNNIICEECNKPIKEVNQ